MAEKDKRSRALLRNLRKQARKGTLSSRERKTLLDQESKFRKARRGTAKGVGLGLAAGAAGLLASPAAQKALGTAADRFKSSKADRKASRAEEEKAKAFNELQESATPTADADQAVAERVMQGGEDFNAIPEGPETVDFSDPKAMGATRASSRDNDEDFANAAFDRSQRILAGEELTGDPLMDLEVKPIGVRKRFDGTTKPAQKRSRPVMERGFGELPYMQNIFYDQDFDDDGTYERMSLLDDMEYNARAEGRDVYTGGFGNDIDYSDLQGLRDRDLIRRQLASDNRDREAGTASGRRIAFDKAFPPGPPLRGGRDYEEDPRFPVSTRFGIPHVQRAEEGEEMPDPFAPVMTRRGMDLGALMGESGIPAARQDGPRVQAQGGKVSQADKLRKMIAKKYGIR